MAARWLFVAAYACSGLAGLVYEVSWTRLLTLYIGHTTAAASAVVAAFMGGLALGAAGAGRIASRLSPRQCLFAYAALEAAVIVAALLIPLELRALTPLLRSAYANGNPGVLFPVIRLVACFVMILIPTVALGATFPVAVRWLAAGRTRAAGVGGGLYAANTAGAAVGALVAGFVIIPAIGVSGATFVGIAASLLAIAAVLVLARAPGDGRIGREPTGSSDEPQPGRSAPARRRQSKRRDAPSSDAEPDSVSAPWLAAVVLGVSGFASLIFEIAWTRVIAMTMGPTTYAFAATLAALITGLAIGSGVGAWAASRVRRPAAWLAFALAAAAASTAWVASLAGHEVPRLVAEQFARTPEAFDQMLSRGAILVGGLVLPTAVGLGAAFSLALATLGGTGTSAPRRYGLVYAVNTIGAVAGSLASGFVIIPALGLQQTMTVVAVLLVASAMAVVGWGTMSSAWRLVNVAVAATGVWIVASSPPWDRQLLASGAYMYAPYVDSELDLITQLKAGTLLYYREGAASTVSVKRLTGTLSLALDGKTDASNRSDMLTQKVIAHLPLLLHPDPKDVFIVGVGSGVTLASALRHPIARADIVEISPDVVEASRHFAAENRHALDDPRSHLIVADGRSHLQLTTRKYDVIVSEPSNPWIAGVAALFTREFFAAARDRLAPGGVMCQWANIYNISDADLRSIAATFISVFPGGTVWLVGENDALFIASADRLDDRLGQVARGWTMAEVADDLRSVAAVEPFTLLSLFAGGPEQLQQYGAGAEILTDDRMRLEFSAPRDVHSSASRENAARLRSMMGEGEKPEAVRKALAGAGAEQWQSRAAMMFRSDFHRAAYDDYLRALTLDPARPAALDGFAQAAIMARRAKEALERLDGVTAGRPATPPMLIARSKLLAAAGAGSEALAAAERAAALAPSRLDPLEQQASLLADAEEILELGLVVERMQEIAADRAPTLYYGAVARFLRMDYPGAAALAERAAAADPQYAPVYDLLGAAYTRLERPDAARTAFETSLRLNAHDSTAYTNLGLLELSAGNRAAAAGFFAEALWLDPGSPTARRGLAQAAGS